MKAIQDSCGEINRFGNIVCVFPLRFNKVYLFLVCFVPQLQTRQPNGHKSQDSTYKYVCVVVCFLKKKRLRRENNGEMAAERGGKKVYTKYGRDIFSCPVAYNK